MNKKVIAIALALVMILGLIPTLTTLVPVQAQAVNTQKQVNCNLRHYNDSFDNPLDSPFCIYLHPGVADGFNPGWSHTLGTLAGVEDLTHSGGQRRQVFEKYLDYAILASGSDSIGDLQFDFMIMPHGGPTSNVSAIDIFVPPEFQFKGATPDESVWSDITNDYQFISVSTRSAYDMVAPNWNRVEVGAQGGWDISPGIYHIRILDLRAPEIAGIYFFKIAWWDADGTQHILHVADYPFVVVKTDLNPAYIEVTVRTDLHYAPPFASGRVIAVGTTPEGRSVTGATYFSLVNFVDNSHVAGNLGAEYTTWLFGLAAGTYTLTAEASGFLPTTTDRITLDPGQSFTAYIVVYYSPEVSVTVWSKHGTGALPWGNLWQLPYGTNNPDVINMNATWRDMLLELYDSNNNLIAFWASNVLGAQPVPGTTAAGITELGILGPATHPGLSPLWLHDAGFATKSISATTKLLGFHDDEAPAPSAVSFYAKLCDNFDVLGIGRGYPSTHWDGHVPWATADYIAGYANGDYSVEAFVTGYIMDEADAYQRAFSLVGSSMNLQFDLRRSNWLEVSMHLPANGATASGWTEVSVPTTVTLTAEDAAASERGAIAFLANAIMCTDGVLDGLDASYWYYDVQVAVSGTGMVVPYFGGLIIEGWNAVFPNVGGRSAAQDIKLKDYGLNPTASTHSAGAVTLAGNPYTIKLYMADMGYPYNPPLDIYGYPYWNATGWYSIVGGDPQASVFLCNSRVALSFSIVNAHIEISLRSVDFEIPAHSRPWTFPGSEIYVDFKDMSGTVIDSLDPTIYGLFQDPGWKNATGVDDEGNNYWAIRGVLYPAGDGTHGLGWTPYDNDNVNMAGHHEHLWVPYFGTDYCSPTVGGGKSIYRALIDARSTRLPAGEYTYEAKTHGYIMRRSFPVQLPQSGVGDIEADMIQGGQIRVTVDFYHEGVPTNFDGFIYAEAYDSAGNFVGASIYGQAQPNLFTRITDGGGYLDYNPINDQMVMPGPAQATGLNERTTHAAFPYTMFDSGPLEDCELFPSCSYNQRAFQAWYFHTYNSVPATGTPEYTWANWYGNYPPYYEDPGFWFPPNHVAILAGNAHSMDMYGFYQYYGNAIRTWAGGWPVPAGGNTASHVDSGMRGSVDVPGWSGSGAGLYTVKVWAFDSRGPDFYPNEHTKANDDFRMYAMGHELTNVQVPWGGAVELYVPMNDLATLTGTVRWFDMYGNLFALPWAQVTASPGPSTDTYPAYQTNAYIMWLPAGSHDVSVSTSEAPQVWTSAAPTQNAAYTVVVSDGWVGGGDSQLSTSGTPVPEVPAFAAPLALFAVLAASVWLLRKKSYNIPVLMK